jgi:lipopolysaccharide biosynthesis glycosyltransferase
VRRCAPKVTEKQDSMTDHKNISDLHICFATNNNYARYCGTAIASILLNAGSKEVLHFYIIDGGISKKNRLRLEKLKKIRDCSIDIIKIDPKTFETFPLPEGFHSHISVATYYRIVIPSLFPHLEKVLYLDCDLIVISSLNPIFEIDIGEYYAAAVVDVYEQDHKQRLNLQNYPYFNTGVLLINCSKWRAEQIESIIFAWIRDHKELIKLADQDVINFVMAGKIRALAEKFNVFEGDYYKGNCQQKPAIIHYVGPFKPWNPWTKKISAKYFFEVLKKTPWNYTKYWVFIKNLPLIIYEESKRMLFRISPALFKGQGNLSKAKEG